MRPVKVEYNFCVDASLLFHEVYEDRGPKENALHVEKYLSAEDVGRPDLHRKNYELLNHLAEVYPGIPIEMNAMLQ